VDSEATAGSTAQFWRDAMARRSILAAAQDGWWPI
jgi:hypothetical protein